ncbi:MAG TPA: hypothetical protein VGB09_07215 [Candidatus Binatia bacterium]
MLATHPDPTVDHVLKTWAPRMIVQGIDYNDLMTTAARIRTWDDWCRKWSVIAAKAAIQIFSEHDLGTGRHRRSPGFPLRTCGNDGL